MGPGRARTLAAVAMLAACGCAAGKTAGHTAGRTPTASPAASLPSAAAAAGNWPVYHANAARTGSVSGLPEAGPLGIAWRRKLDGAVYGQPLVIGGLVIAATENDSVYGLARASGKIRWRLARRHPGAAVRAAVRGHQPARHHRDAGLRPRHPAGLRGGRGDRFQARALRLLAHRQDQGHPRPAGPDGHPRYDQQRPALAITAGRVYVAFGGLFGDCGPYIGSAVGVPVSGRGALISYRVPTTREGAIWGTGGPTLGPRGALYVSVGNGAATSGRYDGSDSVLALSPGLRGPGSSPPAPGRPTTRATWTWGRCRRPCSPMARSWPTASGAPPTC